MGQEIGKAGFDPLFRQRLEQETMLLAQWCASGRMDEVSRRAGYEVEGWILDHAGLPVPDNQHFLKRVNHPFVVPELSRFNMEINGNPHCLGADVLRAMEHELSHTWHLCQEAARDCGDTLLLIGTLPTIREEDLSMRNVSAMNRYRVLNDQVLHLRGGKPISLCIEGEQSLVTTHPDVMLEAGTTSFQLHLQVPFSEIVRFYNASLILSGPLLALSANSPFLFGHNLWAETRVPLFEQSVETADLHHVDARRVTFGSGYLRHSPMEFFEENLGYPDLLPMELEGAPEDLARLRLHNGTIWRWNRLLVGAGDAPHMRIEQRVMPAGPSLIDMMANAAFYYGAVHFLAGLHEAPEQQLAFGQARSNFYFAARHGLSAQQMWLDGGQRSAAVLLLDELIPMAHEGLRWLGVAEPDANRLLGVVEARVRSGQNGAVWQRRHAARHGNDWQRLVADYLEFQRSGMPVHEWSV